MSTNFQIRGEKVWGTFARLHHFFCLQKMVKCTLPVRKQEGCREAYVEYVERQHDADNEVGESFRHILWKKA
jgi:hypothetical protein